MKPQLTIRDLSPKGTTGFAPPTPPINTLADLRKCVVRAVGDMGDDVVFAYRSIGLIRAVLTASTVAAFVVFVLPLFCLWHIAHIVLRRNQRPRT